MIVRLPATSLVILTATCGAVPTRRLRTRVSPSSSRHHLFPDLKVILRGGIGFFRRKANAAEHAHRAWPPTVPDSASIAKITTRIGRRAGRVSGTSATTSRRGIRRRHGTSASTPACPRVEPASRRPRQPSITGCAHAGAFDHWSSSSPRRPALGGSE